MLVDFPQSHHSKADGPLYQKMHKKWISVENSIFAEQFQFQFQFQSLDGQMGTVSGEIDHGLPLHLNR